MDETEKEIAQKTDGAVKRRSRWRRFLAFFLKHILPLLILGLAAEVLTDAFFLSHSGFFFLVSALTAILVLIMLIATRGSLESLVCLLLALEGGALILAYVDKTGALDNFGLAAWPVTWTRVVLVQLLVAGMLLSWLTILRIRKRHFNTWLVATELLTVFFFSLLVYFTCTYWQA